MPAGYRKDVLAIVFESIGLLVDSLQGVPEFNEAQIMSTPFAGQADGALVKRFIQANGGRLLIQSIDVRSLFAVLMNRKTLV